VSVIDLESFTVEKEIKVVVNPVRLVADSQGDIYVISMGDYGQTPSTLQRIDGATGETSVLGEGSIFALAGDHLYVVHAGFGIPAPSFVKYNILTEQAEPGSFIADAPAFTAISAIGVDPLSRDIYITDSGDYVSSGTLYVFSPEGEWKTSLDTGGIDPNDIAFHIQ
jgi:sugar lactone lactonase YvrE